MIFVLEGAALGSFIEALSAAYSLNRFDQMLRIRAGKVREEYSLGPDLRQIFFEVTIKANMEGWTPQLVTAALEANPGNRALRIFAEGIGLSPVAPAEAGNLQKVVRKSSLFHDAEVFLSEFSKRVSWTCRVDVTSGGGTGTLVGPDLVLTNYHVIEAVKEGRIFANKIRCVFDHKMLADGRSISSGRRVPLAADWLVADRRYSDEDTKRNGVSPADDELDYALIRLAEPVGAQPVGVNAAADAVAPARGWQHAHGTIAVKEPLIVLQHPLLAGQARQAPVQIAVGTVLERAFDGKRVRHDARTLHGSSGSPCLNGNLELIAIHHSGDPADDNEKPKWNQAIPFERIMADLTARKIAIMDATNS